MSPAVCWRVSVADLFKFKHKAIRQFELKYNYFMDFLHFLAKQGLIS